MFSTANPDILSSNEYTDNLSVSYEYSLRFNIILELNLGNWT